MVRHSSFPGILAALASGAVDSFPALRPHQREAWHAFCVQIAVMAVSRAGERRMPGHEDEWWKLLLDLTPDWPGGEVWSLIVEDWTKPALLQPPVVSVANRADYRNFVHTPDEMDVLMTSRNHDIKRSRMYHAQAEDWIFALVTLQTMEGFQGAGNYGISRMNGGFGTRMTFSLRSVANASAAFRMDVNRLLAIAEVPVRDPGISLVWIEPWDGTGSLRFEELHWLYVEVCRRVRLMHVGSAIKAVTATSKVRRIAASELNGRTGDPWAPVKIDNSAIVTPGSAGFSYRQYVRLLDRAQTNAPLLAKMNWRDPEEDVALVAAALVRGQGRTEGLHRRTVSIPRFVSVEMAGKDLVGVIGDIATARAADAGKVRTALQRSLQSLFQAGPDVTHGDEEVSVRKAERWLAHFDERIDQIFFETSFWMRVAGPSFTEDTMWLRKVSLIAKQVLEEANSDAPRRASARMRARARAEDRLKQQLGTIGNGLGVLEEQDMRLNSAQADSMVAPFVTQILKLSVRTIAELRRSFLTRRGADDELIVQLLQKADAPATILRAPAAVARWQVIAQAAAVLAGTARQPPHAPGSSVGAALHRSGYSEVRMIRLTSARGDALNDQVRTAVCTIARAGQGPIDLAVIADILDTGKRSEDARFLIAHEFYERP